MHKKVYLISSIEDYGKLISYCIDNDLTVWRCYWDEREKATRCFHLDFSQHRCFYASVSFYESEGYEIVIPSFFLDPFGNYILMN